MRLAFLFYGPQQPEIAKVMIASARQHMPEVIVTQLTDANTKKVDGVDEIRRIDGKVYPYLLYKHMASMPEPFIRVDYDMIFQGDITHILEGDCDVAMNLHGDPQVLESRWGKTYPYATCVWAGKDRSGEFAEDFRSTHLASGRDDWLGLIPSANEVISSGKYRVKPLAGEVYNYTPKDRDDRPASALVLHYKGRRKHWMLPPERAHLAKMDETRILRKVANSDREALLVASEKKRR